MVEEIKNKFFKSSEELISMFLGLAIVLAVGGIIFNYFQKRSGNIDVPGVSNYVSIDEISDKLNKDQIAEGKGEMTNEKTEQQSLKEADNAGGDYVVKKGDSLWKIASQKYGDGNKWVQIADANNIANPGVIHSGIVLKLPEIKGPELAAADTAEPVEAKQYQVVKGDNLWDLAVSQCGDGFKWTEIWKANQNTISNPGKIEIGMMLTVPATCYQNSKNLSLKR